MIRLAILLLGARALRRKWRILAAAGAVWLLVGGLMLADLSDGKMSVVVDTLGVLLALQGIVELVAGCLLGLRSGSSHILRGLTFMVAGFLVADIPWDNNIASALLFGLAFVADGIIRTGSALLVRSPRWPQAVLVGILEVCAGILIHAGHPLPHRLTVPFFLALLLLFTGASLVTMAVQLRRLPSGASVTSLPLFASRFWHTRRNNVVEEWGGPDTPQQRLFVRVWTAMGSVRGAHGLPVLRRYVAAVDHNGIVSTGHAALEMTPDIYVSHYPAVEIDRSGDEFRRLLNAGPENNVPGLLQPSYQEEAADWCPADRTVVFNRFNAPALRAFWQEYSRDATYNLTARNCSTSAIIALDAATEGILGDRRPLLRFCQILTNPDFWLLQIIRGRAEVMTWTPGLALDYASVLRDVTEGSDRSWRRRVADAWRRRKPAGSDATDPGS